MCGIFGYVGNKSIAAQTVLDGLKLLEYRGYDSWGIAAKVKKEPGIKNQEAKLAIEKHIGKIGNAHLDSKFITYDSNLAIGHTRWATHGGITRKNAHPHTDCTGTISVVHNGIVENFAELKKTLVKQGHIFVSETDTETIPHLIEEFKKKNSFKDAVQMTFSMLHGLNAIVVMDSSSNQIIAAKNGSPLVVGVKLNELFIASDLAGIIDHTKQVVFMKDFEMAVLGKTLELYTLPSGTKIKPTIETISWKFEVSSLGKYKHFMMKEIAEQPKVIENIVHSNTGEVKKLAKVITHARGTFFIAAGTAYNACLAGVYLFSKIAGIHVNSAIASEFNYIEHFLTPKSFVLAASQSGETIDVVEPLSRAKAKGAKIGAIVNVLGSSIYRMADYKLLLCAGPEKAVASTKAYIAKITVMLLLAYAIKGQEKKIKPQIETAAKEMSKMLEAAFTQKMKTLAYKLKNAKSIYVIGRGVSYPSALEAALKIKEVSYMPTEGLAGGELKHGTIALVEKGTPCIVFAPEDETYEAMISNAIEIKSRGGFIIGISSKNSSAFDFWIPVKNLGDATLLTQIVPIQLFAYFLALARGIKDPDKPRNLAKSVTVK